MHASASVFSHFLVHISVLAKRMLVRTPSPVPPPFLPFLFLPFDQISLVFCVAPFLTKGADGGNVRLEALFLGRVRPRGELDEGMKRNFHPGGFFLGYIHVICVDTSQYGLVGDDDDILAALEFHDDRLEADDDVAVTLAASVSVVVLVVVACLEILWVVVRDFLVR